MLDKLAAFTPRLRLLIGGDLKEFEITGETQIHLQRENAYPLTMPSGVPFEPETVDHMEVWTLPYVRYRSALPVLEHWASRLKPGGIIQVIVPNMGAIARGYLKGVGGIDILSLLYGPQDYDDDTYRSSYNEGTLAEYMRQVGLVEVRPYKPTAERIYLEAMKPLAPIVSDRKLKIEAVISVPRLGFMDNFGCVFDALVPLGIGFHRYGGPSWGESLQCVIEDVLSKSKPDIILSLDYDTVFTADDIRKLERFMREYPDVDALAPLQSNRHNDQPLFAMGAAMPFGVTDTDAIPASVFKPSVVRVERAHFGLTMLRASSLAKVSKPWFFGHAGPDGSWREGKLDADIAFWVRFKEAGLKVCLAPSVKVGHLVEMVKWPGVDYQAVYQTIEDYRKEGKPDALD